MENFKQTLSALRDLRGQGNIAVFATARVSHTVELYAVGKLQWASEDESGSNLSPKQNGGQEIKTITHANISAANVSTVLVMQQVSY